MVVPFSLEPRIHSTCIRTEWMPSDRHIPGNASYLSGELLLVEVPKMNYGFGLLFVRRRAKTAWEWLRPGLCGLQRRCDRRAVPRSRPRSSGGCWFRWDFWRLRLTGKVNFPQHLVERVMPWALTMCVTTPVQQLQCLPHTGQSAGRRIVAGWCPAGGKGVSVRSSLRVCCAASAPHQQHVRGMAGCGGRGSHPYLWETPLRRRSSAASSPRVRVESLHVGSQSPDTVER
ncbi:hypothetical protein TcCL_NonESM04386 [Trypanosoma cruzi]|nr:hypothetical protein TcCL_NonESM04386 [Trypanosoma cruzi]